MSGKKAKKIIKLEDDEKEITKAFANFKLGEEEEETVEDWEPKDDYYVHIDIIQNSSQFAAARINSYMISIDSFDPRRSLNFPTDLLNGMPDTLTNRRIMAGIGKEYYEFWKVRRTFSLKDFHLMVAEIGRGVSVRIVRILHDDHDINVY